MFNAGKSILNYCLTLRQQLVPPLCLLCAAPAVSANLCEGCRRELPYLPVGHCPRCALPTTDGLACGACLHNPPHFDGVLAACEYAFPIDRLIQRLKFSGHLPVVPLLADLLLMRIEGCGDKPDLIAPVPLSNERLRERGFNPALEIARVLAKRTGIPLMTEACKRIRHSEAQSGLPWSQRLRNVRGAFGSAAPLEGLSVAVVDDVLTTGATLSEVASVLRAGGARQVFGWIPARTLAISG